MLKKFNEIEAASFPLKKGDPVYIVTREGKILEGFYVENTLGTLVSLDRSPLDGTEKQGFAIDGTTLKPNWCEGKRKLVGACIHKHQAQQLADKAKKSREKPIKTPLIGKSL